jgi:hypothetical protein
MQKMMQIGTLQGATACADQGSASEHEPAFEMMEIVEIPKTMVLRPLRTQTWLLLTLASQQHKGQQTLVGRRVTVRVTVGGMCA